MQFELLVRHPQSSEEEIEEYGEGAGATGEDGAGVEGREGRKGGDGTRRDRTGGGQGVCPIEWGAGDHRVGGGVGPPIIF